MTDYVSQLACYRPPAWLLALAPAGAALFGAAMVIAVLAPRGGSPGAPEAQPVLGAGQGPAEAPQPSGETIAAKGDVDATRLSVIAPVKLIGSEERPTNFDALSPRPAPTHAESSGGPSAAPVAAVEVAALPPTAPAPPVAAAETAAPPPSPSRSPDSTPERTATAPPEAIAAPSAANVGKSTPAAAPQRAAAPAPLAETKVVVVAHPNAPNPDSRAKLLRRTSLRVTAANTAATAPGATAETLGEQGPEASPAPVAPQAAAAPVASREPVNLVTHAFGALAGALGAPTADQTASKSGDWAIQFAAPKSQAEAEAAAARLNAKYAGALNGATIDVHKIEVNGETIYALRAAGLSKAVAASLCARVKGRDCSIVK